MKKNISIAELKSIITNKSYSIPDALDLINNKLDNKNFSLNDLLDFIKHEQLRTVIYIMGYFLWKDEFSSITNIGGKRYYLPIVYSIENFLCSKKSIVEKIEEIDHVNYSIKSLYFLINLKINNPCGEMYYITENSINNVVSIPLRTKSTWWDITPTLFCGFEGFFELNSLHYRKNYLDIKNAKFPLKDIDWLYIVDDDCIPVRERFSIALAHKNIKSERTHSDALEYLDLSQIEILQEDFIKFIIDQNIAKKITNKANIDEKNKMEELQNLLKQHEETIKVQKKEIEQLKKESISIKTKKFIKALIFIHYGSDVASSPEIYLGDGVNKNDTKASIRKDFELHGIKPSIVGKTLKNWLKGVELDYYND